MTIKRVLAGAAAFACLAIGSAAPAAADFTPPYDQQCSGDAVVGGGSSVGNRVWQIATADFSASGAPEACPALQPSDVTYGANSSGEGLATLLGSRDPEVRFVGTAEAPGPIEAALLEEGDPFTSKDNARLHTIPQFVAPIAVIVNFPEGCTIPEGSAIGEGTTQRFQVPNATLEAALAGDKGVDTWGEMLPGIGGEGCAVKPLIRIVRDERAGATFALKRWLHSLNGLRGWKLLSNPLLNREWPHANVNLIRAADTSPSGNVDEAAAVKATDGSIGYAALDAARSQGFSEQGVNNDDNYWIPLRSVAGELEEPSLFPITLAIRGANCGEAEFMGVPNGEDPTLESWRNASAVSTEKGYPLCTLVHALAWDDAADAYGAVESEQARQRMVRDFLGFLLSDDGQLIAISGDQSPLPVAVREAARGGQQQLGWAK